MLSLIDSKCGDGHTSQTTISSKIFYIFLCHQLIWEPHICKAYKHCNNNLNSHLSYQVNKLSFQLTWVLKHVHRNSVVHQSLTSSGSLGTGPSLKCDDVNQNIPKTYVNILLGNMKRGGVIKGKGWKGKE